jgi:hypothetical protein
MIGEALVGMFSCLPSWHPRVEDPRGARSMTKQAFALLPLGISLILLTNCDSPTLLRPPAVAYRLMAPPPLEWAIRAMMPSFPTLTPKQEKAMTPKQVEAQVKAWMTYIQTFDRRRTRVLTVTQWLPYAVWHEGPPYPTLAECETERFRWRRVSREFLDPELMRKRVFTEPLDTVLEEFPREQAAIKAILAYDVPMAAAVHARCVAVR